MTRALKSGRKGPPQGQAKAAVVFVHGYGADGADLLGLADPLGPHLPGVAFFSPDAPEPCVANPAGFQWFPIPWIDGSDPVLAAKGQMAAAADLDAFLDKVLEDEGLTPDRLALVGFSQGTMMSLQVAPRRAAPLAAVVGFSGRLLNPESLGAETVSRPPVLLVHGDLDDVVPPASLPEAEEGLKAAGFDVTTHVSQGVGHGIAPDGLSLALGFLREHLGLGG
jgi:phospholipase/carboxylesterase